MYLVAIDYRSAIKLITSQFRSPLRPFLWTQHCLKATAPPFNLQHKDTEHFHTHVVVACYATKGNFWFWRQTKQISFMNSFTKSALFNELQIWMKWTTFYFSHVLPCLGALGENKSSQFPLNRLKRQSRRVAYDQGITERLRT